jgi:hypothetical protein
LLRNSCATAHHLADLADGEAAVREHRFAAEDVVPGDEPLLPLREPLETALDVMDGAAGLDGSGGARRTRRRRTWFFAPDVMGWSKALHGLHAVRLRGGFGDELLANIFAAVKIDATLSDKGRYTDRLVRHMDGLLNQTAW